MAKVGKDDGRVKTGEYQVTRAKEKRFHTRRQYQEMTEFVHLPAWVRTAVTMLDVLGMSKGDICKRFNKSERTFNNYLTQSPAVRQWREQLEQVLLDPKQMAEMTLKSNSLNVSLEYMAAYEKAIEASDYKTVASISQDLLDRVGITKKKEQRDTEKLSITLNMGSTSLDVPQIEATYEAIETDYEVLDETE